MAAYTSLDGGLVEIGGVDLPVQPGATRFAVYESTASQHEFALGELNYGEWVASGEGVELTEGYTLSSGSQVSVGHQTADDPVTKLVEHSALGVWYGSRWSMTLWLHGADSAQIIATYNEFSMAEKETGVVLNPRLPESWSLVRGSAHAPEVDTHIEGLGSIEVVQRTPEQAWQVPSTNGVPVAGGELWVEDPESHNPTFLLANDTSISRIWPEKSPEAELIDRCSRLEVSWTPAEARWL